MEAVYLICLEPSEHILRKAYRLSYRFEKVKILASTEFSLEDRCYKSVEVVNVSQDLRERFNRLECTRLSLEFDFVGRGDLAEKRTFALQDAADRKYRKILIIDDDIWPIPESHRRQFVSSSYQFGGQPPIQQPDLSSIERIDRSGIVFHNKINGNYLYLTIDKKYPFFPRIYNEDWVFIDFIKKKDNYFIFQRDYQIFQSRKNILNSDRAYFEEFGELVIEILIMARQKNTSVSRNIVDRVYFGRQSYLANLSKSATCAESSQSVEAALRALDRFDPSFVLDYIRVVRAEMGQWHYV